MKRNITKKLRSITKEKENHPKAVRTNTRRTAAAQEAPGDPVRTGPQDPVPMGYPES